MVHFEMLFYIYRANGTRQLKGKPNHFVFFKSSAIYGRGPGLVPAKQHSEQGDAQLGSMGHIVISKRYDAIP